MNVVEETCQLLSIQEAATLLGCVRSNVTRLIKRRKLTPIILDNETFIGIDDVEKWKFDHRAFVPKKCLACGMDFMARICYEKKAPVKYCSKECYNSTLKGSGNPNWRNGVSEPYELLRRSKLAKKWTQLVFKNDNYTCQHCGDKRGGNLHAHHIIPFSVDKSLRFEISNGITLCEKCHKKEHKRIRTNSLSQLNIFDCKKRDSYE